MEQKSMTDAWRTSSGRVYGLALFVAASMAWVPSLMAQPAPATAPEESAVRIDESVAVDPDSSLSPLLPDDDQAIPTQNLWEIILWGGPLMIPIALCSLLLVAFALERAISLRRSRVIPKPFTKRFLQQLRDGELDRQRALELCKENGSPVAEVFAAAARKWGRASVEVEQAIIDAGERATNGLRRYLRVLNGIATVAPLLGLLGTVVGMIRAFNDIGHADVGERAQTVAIGISQALLTTAGGLTVAIPALICYLFFVSRVDRLIIDIDAMGQEVVGVIAADEPAGRKSASSATSRRSNRQEPSA